ncbi:MAG: GDP-mannose 4,6-dehydratase, partial [Nodosilinea sp.]
DPRYLRPAEVDLLIGDAAKARQSLGWEPSVTFEQLVHLMVESDLAAVGIPHHSGRLSSDVATVRKDMLLTPQG